MRRDALFVLWVAAACGGAGTGSSPAPTQPARQTPAPSGLSSSTPPTAPARTLSASATFADLVALIRALDTAGAADSDRGCLLETTENGATLAADLLTAVNQKTVPPADLDAQWSGSPPSIRLLSHWGSVGPPSATITLVTLTSFYEPASPSVVVAVSNGALYVGTVGEEDLAGAVTIETLADALRRMPAIGAMPVFVTAEASVPLDRMLQVIGLIDEAHPASVVLATALPRDTRVPADSSTQENVCPGGDPPPAPQGTADGEIDPSPLLDAEGSFQISVRACMERAAHPVRLDLAMRVNTSGAIDTACVLADPLADAPLRACLVNAAQTTRLAPPTPRGYAVVVAPIRYELQGVRQRGLCGAAR